MNAASNGDVALLEAGYIRIARVGKHNLRDGTLHDHFQIAALFPQYDAVMLR